MKKKEGGVEGGGDQSHFLLLPESLTAVQNMLLMPAHSRTARLPEQPLPYGITGALEQWGGLLGLEKGGRDRVGDLLWDFPPSSTPSFIYLFTSWHIT